LAHVKVAARYGKRRDWQRKRALATSHHKNVSRHWPKSVHRYSRWSGCPDSRSSAGLDWQLTAVCAVPQSGNFARMFCRCFREEDTGKPPSDDRITCCGLGTSAASTRLWLCYALRVLTAGSRWHPGEAPVCLPCGRITCCRCGTCGRNPVLYGLPMNVVIRCSAAAGFVCGRW
jgi:hypothetical protein